MCTLTWRAVREGGYDLFFNRDEHNTRASESPPAERRSANGVRHLAPVDGDHGGTWLMLNAHGLTVCVLNDYPRGIVETGRLSRGRLPLAVAGEVRATEAVAVMRTMPLAEFAPFHLVAIDARAGGVHARWDGRRLHEAPAPEFLTSSSFDPAGVRARRSAAYAACAVEERGATFHWAHDPSDGAGSVLMRRPDAATRSVCSVRVRPVEALRELAYQAVAWPEAVAANTVMLRV